MIVMLGRTRVTDFAGWKSAFDAKTPQLTAGGLHLCDLWRDTADPDNVYIVFEVESLDKARALEAEGVLEGEYGLLSTAPVY